MSSALQPQAASVPGGDVSRERQIAADIWGEKGAALYRPAIEALHAFAQATGCPAGADVVKWYGAEMDRWQGACRADYDARKATTAPETALGGTEPQSGGVRPTFPLGRHRMTPTPINLGKLERLVSELRTGQGLSETVSPSGGVWRDAWLHGKVNEAADAIEALTERLRAAEGALEEIVDL